MAVAILWWMGLTAAPASARMPSRLVVQMPSIDRARCINCLTNIDKWTK